MTEIHTWTLEVLRRRNGEHEIEGIKSLDKAEIKKFLDFSTNALNRDLNPRLEKYHHEAKGR